MPDVLTTFGLNSQDAVNAFIAPRLVRLIDRRLVLTKMATAFPIDQGNGKTLRTVRVNRLALPREQLAEGVSPQTVALTITAQDIVTEQWGLVCALTDVGKVTLKHSMLQEGQKRVSLAISEMMEREASIPLMAVSNVTFPGVVTARTGLASTDVLNTAMVVNIVAKLELRGAPKTWDGGCYMGVLQPPHKASLTTDATFVQASSFAEVKRLNYGYVGRWQGVEWVLGNFLPAYVGVAAPDTSAITTTKARYTVGTSGTLATGNYQLKVVARDINTDYERRLSQQTGNIAVTSPGSIAVQVPSSTNYLYDVYCTQLSGTVAYLVGSRLAASSTITIATQPVGNEAVAPVSPANGVTVYPGFVMGEEALGCAELSGLTMKVYLTPDGSSDSDPLAQRRKFGAKTMIKYFILDADFIERFETSSSIPMPLAA